LKGKSVLALIIVLILILGPITVIDIRVDIVPKAQATLREVGSGKTYATIQEGVDAANPGDTVFVYNGTYNESIIVSKTINLTGETICRVMLQ
jgi:pectin methylesterase-like acyl-CoA thioesterase